MQDDPNNFDDDDSFYDDVLEDNFEDELEEDFQEFDGDTFEGEEFASDTDEWASEDGFEGESSDSFEGGTEKKKFKIDFTDNKVIIGAAVLVGLGVFLFQLTGKKAPVAQPGEQFQSSVYLTGASDGIIFGEDKITKEDRDKASEEQAQEQKVVNETPEQDNSQPALVQEEGFLFNPDSLENVDVSIEDTPPMPTPINADVNEQSASNNNQSAIIDQVPRSPVSAKDDDKPLDLFAMTGTQPNSQEAQSGQPIEQEVPKQEAESFDLDVANSSNQGINQKLDTILSRIEKIELELSDVKQQNPNLDGINKTIRSLEDKIATLSQAKPPSKVVQVNPQSPRATPRPTKAAPKWELKAAQPGKAWVSLSGKREIKPVAVGEELSGIGRIKSISFDGSRWVIEGSFGSVFQ